MLYLVVIVSVSVGVTFVTVSVAPARPALGRDQHVPVTASLASKSVKIDALRLDNENIHSTGSDGNLQNTPHIVSYVRRLSHL